MAVTAANVNDITAAQAMPIEAGASYVFDLGYCDYGIKARYRTPCYLSAWAKLDAAGCRIVTRFFKSNTPLRVIEDRAVAKDGAILSDRVGYLPARQAKNRKNAFSDPVREVRVVRYGQNPADSVERSRRQRRGNRRFVQAPLGDRAVFSVGQANSQDQKVPGASENAIRIQIAVALIAYLLLKLAHAEQKSGLTLLAFTRLVRSILMHLKRIDRLLGDDVETPPDDGQMAFQCL